MVSKGNQDLLINLGIVVLVIVVIYVFIIRNPKALDWLKGLGSSKTGAVRVGAAVGDTVTGPNVFSVVGPIAAVVGDTGLSTAGSGSGGESFRDNIGFDCRKCNREATWFFVPGTSGDWSIKMGSHGGGSDNGSLIELGNIDIPGGGGSWRCEGPHQNYQDVSGGEGSGPDISGSSRVGIKGITWSTGPETIHHEIWFNETGDGTTWENVATFEGSASGCNPITCPVPSGEGDAHCQDTLRIDDASGHEFISRSIVEIDPASGAVGGGTPPTQIPTQDRDGGGGGEEEEQPPPEEEEEEEPPEEEEEEPEDEEEEPSDGDGEAGCEGTRCTCPNGAFFTLPSCEDSDCARRCGSSANSARIALYSQMYRAFGGKNFRYTKTIPLKNGYAFTANKRHLRMSNLL